jgi:glycosyltransferase involved in cell wall biosynthesis
VLVPGSPLPLISDWSTLPPAIGLMMIVKNEAETLPRLAASLAGQIDHYTIVDTGSTDDTVALIPTLFGDVPGVVIEDEWRAYGESRNVALEAAREHTDWLVTFDADEIFEGRLPRELLDDTHKGIEALTRFGPLSYFNLRLVRSNAGWRWFGRVHDYLGLPDGPTELLQTHEFQVLHRGDGGNRPTKWLRELELLRADHAEQPENARTVMYLARGFDDLGLAAEAAHWYRKRLAMGGWDEELFLARWRLGATLIAVGDAAAGCGELWRSWGERPWRAEPLGTLAEHYRTTSQWRLAWEACELAHRRCGAQPLPDGVAPVEHGDRLFVHTDVCEWRIAYEQSIVAWYVDEREQGRKLLDYVIARPDLPADIRVAAENNRRYYEAQ